MGVESATTATHNSHCFHKLADSFGVPARIARRLEELAGRLLHMRRPKRWFRAWLKTGLANFVRGDYRLLPCGVAEDVFFVEPLGEARPCNGMEESMGSFKRQTFDGVSTSSEAQRVRDRARSCTANCWMIGSVSPAMKKDLRTPAAWILRERLTGTCPATGRATSSRVTGA